VGLCKILQCVVFCGGMLQKLTSYSKRFCFTKHKTIIIIKTKRFSTKHVYKKPSSTTWF
jgi:hypothetical protein